MGNFPAAEAYRTFYLVAILQEFDDIAKLGLEIMLLNVGTEPNFLDVDNLLVLASLFLFLLLFVAEFAIVLV